MFARFCTLWLIVFSAVLFFSVDADAIEVDYVGPESSYDNYLWAGATQYSRADFDAPYGKVHWYVKKKGEKGYGTEEYVDYGDGIRTSSQFRHTFDTGSTSGEAYVITAYAYPDCDTGDGIIDEDSYTLNVYTHPDEVITFPDELTITNDIKIGDSYAFDVEVTSSCSNYVIDEIEVLVDDVSVVTHGVYGVTSTSITCTGSLPASAGDMMKVEAKIKGGLKIGGKFLLAILAKQVWRATLRTTLTGDCECLVDGNPLDNKGKDDPQKELPFWCWVEVDSQGSWVKDTRSNTTIVEYEVLKANNFLIKKKRKAFTNNAGTYIFSHKVPIGYLINVTLNSDDMHFHAGNKNHPHICKYKFTKKAVDTGNVVLEVIPKSWDPEIQVNFSLNPDSVHDPCDGAYP